MATRTPNPDDINIGNRVRMARLMKGISQTDLGKEIGVTFQQVQKYEKGVNRIGGGRLIQIADALGQPVAWFFDDVAKAGKAEGSDLVMQMLVAPGGINLSRAFLAIDDHSVRACLVAMIEATANSLNRDFVKRKAA